MQWIFLTGQHFTLHYILTVIGHWNLNLETCSSKKCSSCAIYICSTAGFSSSQVVSVYILLFQRPIEIKSGKFQKEIYVYMVYICSLWQKVDSWALNPIQFGIRHDVLHGIHTIFLWAQYTSTKYLISWFQAWAVRPRYITIH